MCDSVLPPPSPGPGTKCGSVGCDTVCLCEWEGPAGREWLGVGVGDQALEGVAGPSLTPRRRSKCPTFLLSFVGVEPTSMLGILSFQEGNPGFPWNLGERSTKREGLSDVPVIKYRAADTRKGPALDSSLWSVPAAKPL